MAVSPQKPLAHPMRTFEVIRLFVKVIHLYLKSLLKAILAEKCILNKSKN